MSEARRSEPRPVDTVDFFGTYLNEIRGETVLERIVDRVRESPASLGTLLQDTRGTTEEVVSALVKAEALGFVRVGKSGDETIVSGIAAANKL